MLKFNELRIDNETNQLIIDASVLDITADPQHTIGINHIYVGYGTTTTCDLLDYRSQAENATHTNWVTTGGDSIYERIDGTYNVMRGFRIIIDLRSISDALNIEANKQLIYVRIEVDVPAAIDNDIPCSIKRFIEGCAYNRCIIYNPLFDYLKISDTCANRGELANYIAQIKGLELAIESGKFTLANKYWQKFFINNNIQISTGCGCH